MKILYVHGENIWISGIVNALTKLDEIFRYLVEHEISHIVSINLVQDLALAAQKAGIQYLSVIWDAPFIPLFSEYGRMGHCWFAVFDKKDLARFEKRKVPHIIYQPLAADSVAIEEWNKDEEDRGIQEYSNEICFVGNLYDNNFFDEFCRNMPQELMDYFTDFFEKVSFRWDGINRIYGTVSDQLLTYIRGVTPGFQLINFFEVPDTAIFEQAYLDRKTANIERVCILNMLAENYPVTLYTASETAERVLEGVKIMPPASAGYESYKIVMARTPEELVQKVDYYLKHDSEREQIALAGHKKVMNSYTYVQKMKSLIDWITECERGAEC